MVVEAGLQLSSLNDLEHTRGRRYRNDPCANETCPSADWSLDGSERSSIMRKLSPVSRRDASCRRHPILCGRRASDHWVERKAGRRRSSSQDMDTTSTLRGLVDYHLHTGTSKDARGVTEEGYCRRALELGLREICFTNHWSPAGPDYSITPEELSSHWQEVQRCRATYPQLGIRVGLEMDYFRGREDEAAATVAGFEEIMGQPFDYILGSVHYLHGIHYVSQEHASELYERYPIEGIFEDYFALLMRAVRSELFDVMSHPDIIKKHCVEMCDPYPFERYRHLVAPVVEALLDEGVGMEMNTKGLTHPVHEMNPSVPFMSLYVSRARERGVEPVITLGSDAHRHHQLGRLLKEGVEQLRACGVDRVAVWRAREVTRLPLPGDPSAGSFSPVGWPCKGARNVKKP